MPGSGQGPRALPARYQLAHLGSSAAARLWNNSGAEAAAAAEPRPGPAGGGPPGAAPGRKCGTAWRWRSSHRRGPGRPSGWRPGERRGRAGCPGRGVRAGRGGPVPPRRLPEKFALSRPLRGFCPAPPRPRSRPSRRGPRAPAAGSSPRPGPCSAAAPAAAPAAPPARGSACRWRSAAAVRPARGSAGSVPVCGLGLLLLAFL